MFDNTESGLMTDEGEYIAETKTDAEAQSAEALTTIIETEPEAETVNKWALRDRLRSRVAWEAVASLIMAILSAGGLWEKLGMTEEWFKAVVTLLFAVFGAFGIFNDPTNREGF